MMRRAANTREQWGAPIGKHDAIAQKLASMTATTYAMEAITYYASGLADAHTADIRLEAAMAKLFCSEWACKIIDDALQIRGGRGYETEASLKGRGETAWPIERMMRDHRINRIIEGASEIMRLFIIREALDKHMKTAGSLVNPRGAGGVGNLVHDAVKAGMFYARWYPVRWMPHGLAGTYRKYGKLARHMRWISRQSNRLARNLFHLMILNGPGLEKRQALLGRVVDMATDLFAMACSISHARYQKEAGEHPEAGELANEFCLLARSRINEGFRTLWRNDDRKHYAFARKMLDGRYGWMEQGVMPVEEPKNTK